MPRKTKTTAVADKAAQPQFSAAALEQLIPGPVAPGMVREMGFLEVPTNNKQSSIACSYRDRIKESFLLYMLSKIPKFIGFALVLVVPTAASAQTFDCSAHSNRADQLICQNPSIGQQKALYEKTLMELRKANPGSLDQILAINRQKVQDLNARCQTAECVSTWYGSQIAALRDGTWASQHQLASTTPPSPAAPVAAVPAPAQQAPNPVQVSAASPTPAAQPTQPAPQTAQREEPQQEGMATTGEEQSSGEADFKAWQASQPAQAKEPEPEPQTQKQAAQAPARAEAPEPVARKSGDPIKDAISGLGTISLIFIVLIGLPLSYPFWKLIVWMDKYVITRAERYHRSAAAIILSQVGFSIACGLACGYVIVVGVQSGFSSLFNW